MGTVLNFVVSAWSFYFRWPKCNAKVYLRSGIFLGGLLQSLALLIIYGLLWFTFGIHAESKLQAQGVCLFIAQFGLSAWTGFFHEDGFADTADSLGVSRFSKDDEPRIQAAFKDPRLGVFGVSALIGLWMFRYHTSLNTHTTLTGALIAICMSRVLTIAVGVGVSRSQPKNDSISKISHQLGGLNTSHAVIWTLICLLICCLLATWLELSVFTIFLQSLIAVVVASIGLRWLCRRSGELNGDMLGASACCLEILILLIFSL